MVSENNLTTEQRKALALANARKKKAESAQPQSVQPSKNIGPADYLEGIARSAVKGGTFAFGDEITAALASLPTAALTNLTVPQAYQLALDAEQRKQKQFQEQAPITSTVAEIGGGILSGAGLLKGAGMAAPKLAQGATQLATKNIGTKALAGSGLGAGGTGLYEYGERGEVSPETIAIGGAIGGGASLLGGLGSRYLTNRARKLRELKRAKSGETSIQKTAQDIISPEQAMAAQRGEILTLTKGDVTQNPEMQALEQAARRNQSFDQAQELVSQLDALRQQELRGTMAGLGAQEGGEQALSEAGKMVRQAYKGQQAQVRRAYDRIRGNDVFINKQPLQETLAPAIKEQLAQDGFDTRYFSAQGQDLINKLTNNKTLQSEKVTGVKLDAMENWRKQVNQAIEGQKDNFGKLTPEGVALSRVKNMYDDFMAKLPDDALKTGDAETLGALNEARAARRRMGVLFERNKKVAELVKNEDLSNEQLANMVLTGNKEGEKINKGAGITLKSMLRAVPEDKKPLLRENLKKGAMSRLLENSQETFIDRGTDYNAISPNKLRKNIDTLMKNKTFVNELFDADEQKVLNALARDLRRISSNQQGTINYSNTAYALSRAFKKMPVLSAVGEYITEPLGRRAQMGDLEKSLSNMIGELSGTQQFYGAGIAAPAANIGGQE